MDQSDYRAPFQGALEAMIEAAHRELDNLDARGVRDEGPSEWHALERLSSAEYAYEAWTGLSAEQL